MKIELFVFLAVTFILAAIWQITDSFLVVVVLVLILPYPKTKRKRKRKN